MKFVQPKNIQDIFIRWNEFQPFEFTNDICIDYQLVADAYIQLELEIHEIMGWIELEVNVKHLGISEAEFFDRLNTTLKSKMNELESFYLQILADFIKLRNLYYDECTLEIKTQKYGVESTEAHTQQTKYSNIREQQIQVQIKRSLNSFHPVRMRMVNLVRSHVKTWQPETKKDSSHGYS